MPEVSVLLGKKVSYYYTASKDLSLLLPSVLSELQKSLVQHNMKICSDMLEAFDDFGNGESFSYYNAGFKR